MTAIDISPKNQLWLFKHPEIPSEHLCLEITHGPDRQVTYISSDRSPVTVQRGAGGRQVISVSVTEEGQQRTLANVSVRNEDLARMLAHGLLRRVLAHGWQVSVLGPLAPELAQCAMKMLGLDLPPKPDLFVDPTALLPRTVPAEIAIARDAAITRKLRAECDAILPPEREEALAKSVVVFDEGWLYFLETCRLYGDFLPTMKGPQA